MQIPEPFLGAEIKINRKTNRNLMFPHDWPTTINSSAENWIGKLQLVGIQRQNYRRMQDGNNVFSSLMLSFLRQTIFIFIYLKRFKTIKRTENMCEERIHRKNLNILKCWGLTSPNHLNCNRISCLAQLISLTRHIRTSIQHLCEQNCKCPKIVGKILNTHSKKKMETTFVANIVVL